jgi:hypothetical protein
VKNYKYLGIIVDHNFKWDMHIRVYAAKFYYLRQLLPFHTMKLLYVSMCDTVSLLRYGLRSWGNATYTKIKQIQTAQIIIVKDCRKA